MRQKDVSALIKKLSGPEETAVVKKVIAAQLQQESCGGPNAMDNVSCGVSIVLEELLTEARKRGELPLKALLPVFLMICGERKQNEVVAAQIDWTLVCDLRLGQEPAKGDKVFELLKEYAGERCSAARRGEIYDRLYKAAWRGNDRRGIGMRIFASELFRETAEHRLAYLPFLYPAFVLICGECMPRKVTGVIDWDFYQRLLEPLAGELRM